MLRAPSASFTDTVRDMASKVPAGLYAFRRPCRMRCAIPPAKRAEGLRRYHGPLARLLAQLRCDDRVGCGLSLRPLRGRVLEVISLGTTSSFLCCASHGHSRRRSTPAGAWPRSRSCEADRPTQAGYFRDVPFGQAHEPFDEGRRQAPAAPRPDLGRLGRRAPAQEFPSPDGGEGVLSPPLGRRVSQRFNWVALRAHGPSFGHAKGPPGGVGLGLVQVRRLAPEWFDQIGIELRAAPAGGVDDDRLEELQDQGPLAVQRAGQEVLARLRSASCAT